MKGKRATGLILALFFAGTIFSGTLFAQSDYTETEPMNSIGIDIGPTFLGILYTIASKDTNTISGIQSSRFGFAVQYERQLLSKLTIGAKAGYVGTNTGYWQHDYGPNDFLNEEDDTIGTLGIRQGIFTLEAHVRFYPAKRVFFLDGMIGYVNLSNTFYGDVVLAKEGAIGQKKSTSFAASNNYVLYGAKLGWRIDFGNPGGFFLEPSLGYYGQIGFGDTIGKTFASHVDSEEYKTLKQTIERIDRSNSDIENNYFLGGFQIAVVLGWRF
jgi:hypothetical protein